MRNLQDLLNRGRDIGKSDDQVKQEPKDEFVIIAESDVDTFMTEFQNFCRRGWIPLNNIIVFDGRLIQMFRRSEEYKDDAAKVHAIKEALEDIGDLSVFGGRASIGKAFTMKIFKIVHGIDDDEV